MNTLFRTKNKCLTPLKHLCLAVVAMVVMGITALNTTAQVVVSYEDEELVIENFNARPIVLFKNNVTKDELVKTNSFVFTPKDLYLEPCGINLLSSFEILRGKKTFRGIKESPKKLVYYFFEDDSPMKISSSDRREVTVTVKQKPLPVRDETESVSGSNQTKEESAPITSIYEPPFAKEPVENTETKPVEKPAPPKETPKKVEPKKDKVIFVINPYTDIVNSLVEKCNAILQNKELSNDERVRAKNLRLEAANLKTEIEKYLESLWEKKNDTKTKCEECDILIKSSNDLCTNLDKVSGRILNSLKKVSDNVVASWKKEYRKEILEPFVRKDSLLLLQINEEIELRSRQSLLGWLKVKEIRSQLTEVERNYAKMLAESEKFITQKKKDYDDDNDKAVLDNLVNEIPDIYKGIVFYKDSLARIKIPYLILSLTGFILLLLLIGIIFYVITIIRNRKIEIREQEMKITNKTILIEEDDVMEVISYIVNISDIKEKAGTDYFEVKMSEIFEDTTIQSVFFSRKAIFDIYKFFSDFLKYNDKTNETGCFLVGRWDFAGSPYQKLYDISIEEVVEPGDDAVYGEYTLNFGAKIGITLNFKIDKLCEKSGKEYVHTAWMHSHPGLGLFLSSQDLNVQSQLAHSQYKGRMLALVLDSNSPDFRMAFFSPKKDGTMNNDNDLKRKFSFEDMYQWAKTPAKVVPPKPETQQDEKPKAEKQPIDRQNYYEIVMQPNAETITKVLLHGSAIIDTDMAIMPDKKGLRGYYCGEKQDNEIILNTFVESSDEFDELNLNNLDCNDCKPVACFMVETSLESIAQHASLFSLFELFVIYSFDDEKLFLLTKDEMNNLPLTSDNKTSVSIMKMKQWTRRVR